MIRAVEVLANGSLGVWLGTIVFFSFVGAPKAFGVLEEDDAGDYVNAVFPIYYIVGAASGVVAFVTGVAHGVFADSFGLYLGVYFACVLVGVGVAVFSRFYLVPRIRDAGDGTDGFEKYHGASVKLNSVMLVVVAVALVVWHV